MNHHVYSQCSVASFACVLYLEPEDLETVNKTTWNIILDEIQRKLHSIGDLPFTFAGSVRTEGKLGRQKYTSKKAGTQINKRKYKSNLSEKDDDKHTILTWRICCWCFFITHRNLFYSFYNYILTSFFIEVIATFVLAVMFFFSPAVIKNTCSIETLILKLKLILDIAKTNITS